MTTIQSFKKLLLRKDLAKLLGCTKQNVFILRKNAEEDKFPTIDTMEAYLLKAGFTVIHEKKWKEGEF